MYTGREYEMERWCGDLRSSVRTGGAAPRAAVAARRRGRSFSALAQPEPRGAATSTNGGPLFSAPALHFVLATTIPVALVGRP